MRDRLMFPPHYTPQLVGETKPAPDVAAVYEEVRQLRRELHRTRRNLMSAISDLSGNVQRLIDIATGLKNLPAPPTPTPVDDPQVVELNQKILTAIAVLTDTTPPAPPAPTPGPEHPVADPNAPVA